MFDLQATIRWVTGVIKTPVETAKAYRDGDPPWLQTFLQLPLPLFVAATVLAGLLSLLLGGAVGIGGVAGVLWMLAGSLIWSFVLAVILDQVAGFFGGEKNFDRAYALVGLTSVISAIGSVLSVVAWLGGLLSLAATVYAIYLAYQFVPIFLGVPEENRVKHIVVSIIAGFVLGLIVFGFIGGIVGGAAAIDAFDSDEEDRVTDVEPEVGGGLFAGVERQAKLAETAQNDRYEPPADGKLKDAQVVRFVDTMKKTAALRERLTKKWDDIDEDNPSLGDIFSGAGDAMRVGTAEMEVVKTAGGNWAEHQWVRSTLETARIQQDINDAVRHNYELFLKYSEDIERYE